MYKENFKFATGFTRTQGPVSTGADPETEMSLAHPAISCKPLISRRALENLRQGMELEQLPSSEVIVIATKYNGNPWMCVVQGAGHTLRNLSCSKTKFNNASRTGCPRPAETSLWFQFHQTAENWFPKRLWTAHAYTTW